MTEKAKEGRGDGREWGHESEGFRSLLGSDRQTNWPSDGATDACDIERGRVPGRLFVLTAWSVHTISLG